MSNNLNTLVTTFSICLLLYFYIIYENKNAMTINKKVRFSPKNRVEGLDETDKPRVTFVYSENCVYCDMMKPIFQQIKNEYRNSEIEFVMFSISDNRSRRFNIEGFPFLFFENKDKNITKLGLINKRKFKEIIGSIMR